MHRILSLSLNQVGSVFGLYTGQLGLTSAADMDLQVANKYVSRVNRLLSVSYDVFSRVNVLKICFCRLPFAV